MESGWPARTAPVGAQRARLTGADLAPVLRRNTTEWGHHRFLVSVMSPAFFAPRTSDPPFSVIEFVANWRLVGEYFWWLLSL